MQNYMLYFSGAFSHFEIVRYLRFISGDSFFLAKREGSARGHAMTMYYRPYIRNVIRQCFYDYKLPYHSLNDNAGILNFLLWKLFYFRIELCLDSSLEEIRLGYWLSLLFFFICSLFSFLDRPRSLQRLAQHPSGNLINIISLFKNFDFKKQLKKVYLWFWP